MKRETASAHALAGVLVAYIHGADGANHDIEFVAEHLAEVAMDNRYATLPVWVGNGQQESVSFTAQTGYASTSSGKLRIEGPMLSAALVRPWSDRWLIGAFVFYDALQLSGGTEERPLQTLFSPATPIERPVAATFSGLDGKATHYGGGISASTYRSDGWLGEHRWVAGLLWQRIELRDYRFDYRIAAGPANAAAGQIDFDAAYTHVTPFAGLELPRSLARWTIAPHVLFAFPWPRRGVVGHISGPGFDLHGDTEQNGNGKHFGDPSLTIGVDLTYQPARLTLDLGTTLTQQLLEPQIHDGIEQNWVISAQWRY